MLVHFIDMLYRLLDYCVDRFVPPRAIWPIRSRMIAVRGVDPRRYWDGELLPAPAANVPIFASLRRSCWTVTHAKESRDCILLESGESVSLSLPSGNDRVRFSFASSGRSTPGRGVQVTDSRRVVAAITAIVPDRWHHVTLRCDSHEQTYVVTNTHPAAVAVAHPIVMHTIVPAVAGTAPPKNIIVIILDSLSHGALGALDLTLEASMSHCARFFANSYRYAQAFVQSEWTFPSVYSLLTSRYPIEHGMSELDGRAPNLSSAEGPTLAEELRRLGYVTFGYSTVKVFHPAFNGHLGFDRFFYDRFPQRGTTHEAIARRAIAQLHGNRDGKNFLLLHTIDTHEPWPYPSEFEEDLLPTVRMTDPTQEYEHWRRGSGGTKAEPVFDAEGCTVLERRRDARLVAIDATLQTLFDYLTTSRQLDNTVVVFTSDHGFPYLSRSQPLLCDTRVHVPLLIRHPTHRGALVHDLVAVNLDLGPTLLAIAGREGAWGEGKALPPFGAGSRTSVISESLFRGRYQAAVRDRDFVYHFTCARDAATKAVQSGTELHSSLFERAREEAGEDMTTRYPEAHARLREVLSAHLEYHGVCVSSLP